MSDVDQTVIISTVVADLTKSFLKSVRDKSISLVSRRYDLIFEDFGDYLSSTYNKCNNVKTVITREKPYKIDEIYVNGMFRCGNNTCDDNALCQDARDNKRIVVTGFGGIGKTIFAKHLWLSIFKEPGGRIPIFFELRRLNALTNVDIETVIRNTLFPSKRASRENLFDDLLAEGRFVFIFDAFDELNEDKKSIVEDQILSIAHRYPECGIVVTSRREHRFDSWEQFHIFKALPFEKEQVKDLIQKIDFDIPVKKKFVSQVVEKNFQKHNSFLSTPLLSLMMLMTFSQYGELPEKIHIFYRYAFQALYAWHDASKEAFRRERKSGLLIDQFEKVFSIFCMMSYYDFETIFDAEDIVSYFEKSKMQVDFKYSSNDFVLEAEQAVNLIFKEGNWYSFTHRSFQEYFTAFALSNYFPNRILEILDQMSVRSTDSMLSMLYEINPVIAEENFLVPVFNKYGSEMTKLSRMQDPVEFLSSINFAIYSMISWPHYRRLATPRSKIVSPNPHFSTHFGNYGGTRKAVEVVCAMFRSKFEAEVGELYVADNSQWISRFESFVAGLVKGLRPSGKTSYLRCVYDLSSSIIRITDRENVQLLEKKVDRLEIIGGPEALRETFVSLKRQVVFAKRLCEAIKRKVSQKKVSINDLLG